MDRNLELALVESLIEEGLADLSTLEERCSAVPVDKVRAAELWGPVPELVECVLSQGLQARFPAIRRLVLDGGSEVYALTSYQWDGEDETFDVRSFAGIEACTALEEIVVISMLPNQEAVSLAPLARLPALRRLSLHAGRLSDAEALLAAPCLERVSVDRYVALVDTDREGLLERLRARGVTVEP